MLHKWEAIMGLPEDSLAYQMEGHYLEGAYPEELEGRLVYEEGFRGGKECNTKNKGERNGRNN